jgi:hypothetical protein
MKLRTTLAALALAAAAGMTCPAFADITGKVNLDGKAPEMKDIDMSGVKECAAQHPDPVQEQTVVVDDKGDLANVVVAIKKAEGQDLPGDVPKEPAVLDQKGCMYHPHVLAVMVGQDFVVKNDDPFLHNVHSLSVINPAFNFGQPNKDDGKKADPMKAAEYFRVKCDVHPWMSAYVAVFEHPYFAVTKDDGTFSIPTAGLPDGDYTVEFLHEKYADDPDKAPTEKVTVKDGKGEVNHTFKAEAAMAPRPSSVKDVVLASMKDKPACCNMEKVSHTVPAKVADASK